MTVRILASTTTDIGIYREVRLAALGSDPQAFCSTLARELAFDDATWRQRIVSMDGHPAATIVDEVDGRVGGVVGVGLTEEPGVATLVGMWVRPDARGTGVAGRLVDAVLGWADEAGARAVALGVVETNQAAIDLYGRCGFVMTGVSRPVPGRPDELELEMTRPVGP